MRHSIERLTVFAGGGCVVVLRGEQFMSCERVIGTALWAAFAVDAELDLETFKGTRVLRRVPAFIVNSNARPGMISRLATQLNPVTAVTHLEVFVLDNSGEEKPFNVIDGLLQDLCCRAAVTGVVMTIAVSDGVIVGATVGADPSDVQSLNS